DRARELAPVIGALARWGYSWAWSSPREGEAIDVGAVFRCTLGLIESAPPPAGGTLELRVDDRAYTLSVEGGQVTLREEPAGARPVRMTAGRRPKRLTLDPPILAARDARMPSSYGFGREPKGSPCGCAAEAV